ncbi:glycosyltransferase [Methylobacter sp.]|uniref:glycosyltransferase family protein n=1 Tax=Methylobacter sp. TaxID=2051955 RepID=UPI00120B575A|nr:glycosyltransferase [Methylobacter sp.]TAK61759.1 MAG: glycosyltransferase family 1 protein [Methylobacter sp.]
MAEQCGDDQQGKMSKDTFFLNIEDAYSEAVKQNKIVDARGGERLQYCYYDGPLTDIVLDNFIQVQSDSFVEFFSYNHLPIPQIIAISQDGVVHFNEMPADIIEEINVKRRERADIFYEIKNQLSDKKLSDFLDRDTYFVDPLLALNEAKQKKRVYCGHPTIDGLQVCYYRGELPLHGIENLIHVELPDLVDFFIISRLRLPERVEMPNDLEEEVKAAVQEDFANALEIIKKKRLAFAQQLIRKAKALKPVVEGEPIRIFIPSYRLTTVMQYSSQGVAKAFEKRGCQVLFYIESNDMETGNVVDMLNKYIDFNPHVTFNVNNVNHEFLHDDVINIMWWQDLMPRIRNHQLINWRNHDFNFSISPIFDQHLKQCGDERVERQHFVIDEDIFYSDDKQQRQQKVIFVGSSYLPVVNLADDQQLHVIAELVEILNQGGRFDEQTVTNIAERSAFSYWFVFWKLLHYVIRDYSVKWLCQNSTLPVEIYGRYWDQDPLIAPFYQGELQHGVKVADAYRSAAYAIVSHPFEINSQRLAEVAACGCIPVVYDCRDVAELPHWDDCCLFFKTEQDLKNILDNRLVPAKSPLLLAQHFTYNAAVEHFIEKSSVKALSGYPTPDAVANHAEPVLVELFGDNVVLRSRSSGTIQACRDRLVKNMAVLNASRPELFNELIAGIQSNHIDIVIDKLIGEEYWEISLALNGNSYYRLDNVALLGNCQFIRDNSSLYKRENTSCYALLSLGSGYELLEAFKNTERPIPEMEEFEVPVYVIEQEPGLFVLNMLLHDWEPVIRSERVQFFNHNAIGLLCQEFLQFQVALPTVLLDMKVQGGLRAEQMLELINQAQQQRAQRYAANLHEIHEYYGSITDAGWQDKFKPENINSLRVMGFISRFSSFLKYCIRDLLDGFDRLGAITTNCIEEENYYLANIEYFIEQINNFKPDIILTINHFRHEFPGVPESIPFVNWIQDILPGIMYNQIPPKTRDFTCVVAKDWLGLEQFPVYANSNMGFLPLGYNDKIYYPIGNIKNYDCDILLVTHLVDPAITFEPIRNPSKYDFQLNERETVLVEQGVFSKQDLFDIYRIIDDYCKHMDMHAFHEFCTLIAENYNHKQLNDLLNIHGFELSDEAVDVILRTRLHYEFLTQTKLWFISRLIDSGYDFNIHIYGNNWDKYQKFSPYVKGVAENGAVLNCIMNKAKICLNTSPGMTLHMRALEIMASGSFMLSRDILYDSSKITDYFSNEEVVLYTDETDFINKVIYYLNNESERKTIAERAYKTLSKTFSYQAIAGQLLKLVKTRLSALEQIKSGF